MSWLLFMDESGHDHKNMPFEARGGVAIHASKLWGFIQGWRRLEEDCFGTTLMAFGKEAKGHKLLDKDRLKWAQQADPMSPEERRKLARVFLEYGQAKLPQKRENFTAYGQACVEMGKRCPEPTLRGRCGAPSVRALIVEGRWCYDDVM